VAKEASFEEIQDARNYLWEVRKRLTVAARTAAFAAQAIGKGD
jgi:hypothetical protein